MSTKKVFFCIAVISVIAILFLGVWLSEVNNQKKDTTLSSNIQEEAVEKNEEVVEEEEEGEILRVVKSELKYYEEFDTELYEVILENTSRKNIARVTFTFGEYTHVLYNLLPNEQYKVTAYSDETSIELSIISVDYELEEVKNDISLDWQPKNGFNGELSNNSQLDIYPNQIIMFFKDQEGVIEERAIEYSGCFFEDLVIKSGMKFEFETNLEVGYTFLAERGIVFNYYNMEDNSYITQFIKEI